MTTDEELKEKVRGLEAVPAFSAEVFLDKLVNTDAARSGTAGCSYLDECKMGEDLEFKHGVLTVEDPDGTKRFFRVSISEIYLSK